MIVRNEAAVVGRCIESVRDLIDSWVIVDTGSTDGTPELVCSLLAGVPGSLHCSAWRDFGANRTELLELARGAGDYLLLLDADMTITRDGPLPSLSCDGYLLDHEGDLAYSVPRLVRGDLPWYYVGATHEYLACRQPFELGKLQALRVVHHADGGSRGDKLTRDRDLLTRQLEASPGDPRTVFYLAQTYRDLGDKKRAAALYALRAQLGAFEEEAFYAAFQHALLTAEDDWPRGRELLADAWERRPSRVEPLYEIAVRARDRGELAAADWATSIGVRAGTPEDILFVHRHVYDWGMRLERSIVSARRGRLGESRAITEHLLGQQELPEQVRAALESNLAWLRDRTPPLLRGGEIAGAAALSQLCRDVEVVTLAPPVVTGGRPPAGASVGGGRGPLACLLRCAGRDPCNGPDSRAVRNGDRACTSEVLLSLDQRLSVSAEAALRHLHQDEPAGIAHAGDVEDWRLFSWRDRWWALATSRLPGPTSGTRQVLLAIEDGRFELAALFGCPTGRDRDQRSEPFSPVLIAGELCAVARWRPFTLLRLDVQRSSLEELVTVQTDCRFTALAGASQGLPVDDGYLFVARQAVPVAGRQRYVHRFIAVDGSLTPSGISEPFTFFDEASERCGGVALRGDEVVLSVATGDGRARLAVAPLEAAISIIDPLA